MKIVCFLKSEIHRASKSPVKAGEKHFGGAISLNLSDAFVPSEGEKKAVGTEMKIFLAQISL